jgi:hypothetical protein
MNALACKVCLGIAKEPVECEKCDCIFCNECVKKWVALNHNTCVHCR